MFAFYFQLRQKIIICMVIRWQWPSINLNLSQRSNNIHWWVSLYGYKHWWIAVSLVAYHPSRCHAVRNTAIRIDFVPVAPTILLSCIRYMIRVSTCFAQVAESQKEMIDGLEWRRQWLAAELDMDQSGARQDHTVQFCCMAASSSRNQFSFHSPILCLRCHLSPNLIVKTCLFQAPCYLLSYLMEHLKSIQ